MADHAYPVEVQPDFLDKITAARPIQALAEFIWNGLDADATTVDVHFEYNALGVMSTIVVTDNGLGMTYEQAPELFRNLGGSWKRRNPYTKKDHRFLHGKDGRGRFKAFALGRIAEWDVTYEKGSGKDAQLWTFRITMNASNNRQVFISDEEKAPEGKARGVVLTISELTKDYRAFTSDAGTQELTEILALYLTDYKGVTIQVDTVRIDPASVIASRHVADLAAIAAEGTAYPARLEIIEWRSMTNRALYLCSENGFPLLQADRRFHVGHFQFSAYLKSPYISCLQDEGTLELAEMNPAVNAAIDAAQKSIRGYFRTRAAEERRTVVDEWKLENIYPYEGEPVTSVEQAERQVFDIVAVTAAQFMADFSEAPVKNKALHLRLIRQAIEHSPQELQVILGEVLKLPKRQQEELADLLRDVSLPAIISAAKIVADRLRFLTGLEAILFDAEPKKRLKERSQLHRIIAHNCWLFGEEYNLSVNDQSLTEVLRKHRSLLGDDAAIDEPVKHITKDRGIVDLMLSRAIRRHRANELTHLVVELKAPKVRINDEEVNQVEKYAFSVARDERFRNVSTTWTFYAISDNFGPYAEERMQDSSGVIHAKGNITIYVKTWGQVLDENRARLQFFQEKLEYQADREASLQHLQDHYAEFLKGVLAEETQEAGTSEAYAEEPAERAGLPTKESIG
jgi:hypothetical protein